MARRGLVSSVFALLVVSVALAGVSLCDATTVNGSVTCTATAAITPGIATAFACTYHEGRVSGAQAWAVYKQTVNETGWAELEVWTPAVDGQASVEAYAAGFLEGVLSQPLMYAFEHNFLGEQFRGDPSGQVQAKVTDFLNTNYEWVAQQAAANSGDTYWSTIAVTYTRLNGMLAGYNSVAPAGQTKKLSDLLIMNAQGDMGDIVEAVTVGEERSDPLGMRLEDALEFEATHSHCSCLFKLLGNLQELFAGHNMWWSYYAMLRVFKTYHTGPFTVMFSSYPGLLSSTDDIYQTSTGLVVAETTNLIYNNSLYDLVHPTNSVMSWARVVAANTLTTTGVDWTTMFAKYNSGTYNNMWMVLDTKKWTPGRQLPANSLVILEQLPGYTQSGDVTQILNYGYFPSYNRCFFAETAALSGQNAMIAKHGAYFSYHGNPRANIFRRSQGNVTDMEAFKWLMRYNEWQTDPLAEHSAGNQIAARYDLIPASGLPPWQNTRSAGGAIDAKLTSATDVAAMRMEIICGPTHETQPVWEWTPAWSVGCPHMLQPARFDFDWITVAASSDSAA